MECIKLLRAFFPSCGICFTESRGIMWTKVNHISKKNCKTIGGNFKKFYDFNKPKVSGCCFGWLLLTPQQSPEPKWGYDVTISEWCYTCALPCSALELESANHDKIFNCLWSDIMMGIAWSIWYNKELFEDMKRMVPCDVAPLRSARY